jgi:ribosome-associated toxin RatA of RatAB toxin-antitoxin module
MGLSIAIPLEDAQTKFSLAFLSLKAEWYFAQISSDSASLGVWILFAFSSPLIVLK